MDRPGLLAGAERARADAVHRRRPARSNSRRGDGNPFGVGKTSYIAGLYAKGTASGTFEEGTNTTPQNIPPDPETNPPTEPFTAWLGRLGAGEPYSVAPQTDDPVVGQVRHAFSHWHSAYYSPGWKAQKAAGRETAVFTVSGWTDDLFPAVESTRMFTYLKGLDPKWPVEARFADVGHSRAQNKPGTWHQINDQAWAFLQSQINGAHQATTTVASQVTDCTDNQSPAPQEVERSSRPRARHRHARPSRPKQPAVLAPTSGTGDPDGARPTRSPVARCRRSRRRRTADARSGDAGRAQRARSATARRPRRCPPPRRRSASAPSPPTTRRPRAPPASSPPGCGTSRPDGTPLLISRGVYRLDFVYGDPLTGTLRAPVLRQPLEPARRSPASDWTCSRSTRRPTSRRRPP